MPNVPILSTGGLIFLVFAFVSTAIIVLLLSRDVVTKYLNKFTDVTYEIIVLLTSKIIKR